MYKAPEACAKYDTIISQYVLNTMSKNTTYVSCQFEEF